MIGEFVSRVTPILLVIYRISSGFRLWFQKLQTISWLGYGNKTHSLLFIPESSCTRLGSARCVRILDIFSVGNRHAAACVQALPLQNFK